ncbi:helix-turn-helix transcriptional regulator [Rhizobium sp. BK602]|uniref:helix-turn-helix domain-containing protein n=1 Tax=Rhizobium sp. BK602 TaxID=2586986 RepID=UPI0017CD80AB|nr:helix-turn-helix transcriptional regulator [Rhizobium sp. BK602]MBB3610327.1 transcriptional regulator with XRE-family HTH domain [Rhizobium sp. BK602]
MDAVMNGMVTARNPGNATTSELGRHPVDIYVGRQIRFARKRRGMSQESLAKCLGLTFQQIQKYEFGTNRVSASRLFEIARALHRPVSYFFEGLVDVDEREPTDTEKEILTVILGTAEGRRLAKAFLASMPHVRKAIIGLLEAVVQPKETTPETRQTPGL